jgi:UDP-2,3-diacylglucosamine pyrophosphatase LpxH
MSDTGTKYKTIIMSDIHLGMKDSKSKEVIDFLENNTCDILILNGDIVDGWAINRGAKLNSKHMKCIRKIMKISEKGTRVYWLRGNHDDFLKNFMPIKIGDIQIQEDLVINSGDKKYFVLHGDVFDVFITKMGWLAKIGSVLYDFSLWLNRWYNRYRKIRGKEYLSIAKKMKESVKFATKFIGKFEDHIAELANRKGYDGVICGHIHYPVIKKIGKIDYMNSGDWVENMSCLVENHNNEWTLEYYSKEKRSS